MALTPDQEKLRYIALTADQNGGHIYCHGRDSNNWVNNIAWHREASPAAILAILSQLEQVQGWLPIETAPLDGREVLLMVELRAGMRGKQLVGHYMPGGHCIEDHPPIESGWYFWNGGRFDRAAKPLKWQPLPPPPEAA